MWILYCVLALCLACIVLGYILFRFMVVRSKKPYLRPDPEKAKDEKTREGIEFILQEYDRIQQRGYETLYISNRKGKRLCGYYLAADKPTNKTVLMIHGYRSCNFYEFAHFALMYLERFGWNVLIVDDYAHGNSDGKYIGFGWADRFDVSLWSKWLTQQFDEDCTIILHGCSMGAAAVLNTAGEEPLPQQVKGVVADCGFASLKDMCHYVAKNYLHIPLFPLYYIASLFCKIHAGYFFGEAEAVRSAAKITVPALIIHGTNDKIVPYENANRILKVIKTPKDLFSVPNAGHGQSILYDRAGYETAVNKLLSQI